MISELIILKEKIEDILKYINSKLEKKNLELLNEIFISDEELQQNENKNKFIEYFFNEQKDTNDKQLPKKTN